VRKISALIESKRRYCVSEKNSTVSENHLGGYDFLSMEDLEVGETIHNAFILDLNYLHGGNEGQNH